MLIMCPAPAGYQAGYCGYCGGVNKILLTYDLYSREQH